NKDDVFPTFKEWKVLIENQTEKKIKKLRTDNGLEFYRESFNALCQKYGIARHHTLLRTLQQNGVAERMNRTIIKKVRCNSVDYSNLRGFGCHVYVDVNEEKLVPHAVKCIFLGYGFGVKGYRVRCPDPKYRKIIHSRDVTFNEDVITNSGKDFMAPCNVDNNHTEAHIENYEPKKYLEAILSLECDKWVMPMEEEVESLHKNKTLELVKLPKEKRVIICKWLFKVKDGIPWVESNRYKA
nr:retrotransposon protein, putative, Ty1-copia subclass [Tanacetum cinerariifolium]